MSDQLHLVTSSQQPYGKSFNWWLGGCQVAERLENRASNQKVAGSIPGRANYVVSLGKALHPTCLRAMSLYLL